MKEMFGMLKEAFSRWMSDGAMQLAAAVSFYAILALAPLLVMVLSVAGLIFGEEAAQGELFEQIESLTGNAGVAGALEGILANADDRGSGIFSIVLSSIILLISASAVFVQLQSSLNRIWNVQQKPGLGVKFLIKNRIFSMGLVLSLGFLLMVSLVISAVISSLGNFILEFTPAFQFLSTSLNFVVVVIVMTLLFASLFKLLPDVQIRWREVWKGAILTSVLFALGQIGIGIYLGNAGVGSSYGAAGSIIVLLLWIYYSSLIMFLGAEFTQVHAERTGKRIEPASNAIRV